MIKIRSLAAVTLAVLFMAASCKNNKAKEAENTGTREQADSSKDKSEVDYRFDKEKPYPYEKGIIEYKYTGDYEGKQTVYFSDYGRSFRVEEDYVNENTPLHSRIQQAFINTPEHFYYINLADKKGYVVDRNDTSVHIQDNFLKDFTTIGIDSTMRKNGYEQAGSQDVSGKQCQVYTSDDGKSKFCFWKGVNIKTEMKYGEDFDYTLEAVKIEENADVADEKFSPPSDIKLMNYKQYVKSQTKDKL